MPPERITRADVLLLPEVAELLGQNPRTVADWARRGRIPSRKRGRVRFFLRWEIRDWLISEDGADDARRPSHSPTHHRTR